MKFRMKEQVGNHTEQRGKSPKILTSGTVVESEEDLCILFPNKFEKVKEEKSSKKKPESVPEPVQEETGEAPEEEEAAVEEDPWRDVTVRFPRAGLAEFNVMERNGLYNVFERTDTEKPLNEVPMRKSAINTFIGSFLKEE